MSSWHYRYLVTFVLDGATDGANESSSGAGAINTDESEFLSLVLLSFAAAHVLDSGLLYEIFTSVHTIYYLVILTSHEHGLSEEGGRDQEIPERTEKIHQAEGGVCQ